MRLIKHGHACLELIENQQRLVIDPGFYTEPMDGLSNVAGIVLTHMHDDHCFEEQLDRILATNPAVKIFGTGEVVNRLNQSGAGKYDVTAVYHGDWYDLGEFQIEFYGDLHAEIHHSIPLLQNCGVMVNNILYYPGDSFTRPDRKVEWLACPSSAPWLKVSEIMDFVTEVKPAHAFATHNIHLSEEGHAMYNSRIQQCAELGGGDFVFLRPGDEVELSA